MKTSESVAIDRNDKGIAISLAFNTAHSIECHEKHLCFTTLGLSVLELLSTSKVHQ
jgi:hypothetical protein